MIPQIRIRITPTTRRLRGWVQALVRRGRSWFARDPLIADLKIFVDVERLARELQAEEQGWEAGRANRPAPDEHRYDEFHTGALARCENALLVLKRRAIHLLEANERAQLAHDPQLAEADLERIERDLLLEIDKKFEDARAPLVELKTRELLQQRELNAFIARNRLQRVARHKPWWLWSGLLILLIFAESFINASMFARGSAFGLVGGWTQAVAIAALNVVLSFLAGMFVLRNLLHVRPWRRVLALVGSMVFLALLALFHLGVGHYRELLEVDPARAAQQAIAALWARGLYLENLEAWALVLVGLIGAALSAADGFMWAGDPTDTDRFPVAIWADGFMWAGDPYPGYGRIDGYHRRAREEFAAAVKRLWVEIEKSVARGEQRLQARIDPMKRELAEMLTQVRAFEGICSRYRESAWQIESACIRVLEIYRDANRRVRTAPAPAYFDTAPELHNHLDYDLDASGSRCAQYVEWIDAAEDQLRDIRERLQRKKQDRFAGLAEYLADVEGSAKAQAEITGRLFEHSNILREELQPSLKLATPVSDRKAA